MIGGHANQYFKCHACGAVHEAEEFDTLCTYPGNREEPPEYELVCPDCGECEGFDGFAEMSYCPDCEDFFYAGDEHKCEVTDED